MEQLLQGLYKYFIVDNFSGFATVWTGLVAWSVYAAQKRDHKINAARILLAEIRGAEKRVDEVGDLLNRKQTEYPSVLPVNSWREFSYLFASDFDQDELDEINDFYNLCERLDDAVKKDNNYFWLTTENISKAGQTIATQLIRESVDKKYKLDAKKLAKLKIAVLDNVSRNPFMYSPQKTLDTITVTVQRIQKITTNTTGAKLKSIANSRTKWFLNSSSK